MTHTESQKEEMRKAVLAITDFLNHSGANAKRQSGFFYEVLTDDHPTLQQSFWRMMREVILLYANAPYDARNKASVFFCQYIKAKVEDFDSGFPMI